MKFSGRWPRAGMMQNGKCYRQQSSVLRTSDPDCLLFPTPCVMDSSMKAVLSRVDLLRKNTFSHDGGGNSRLNDWIAAFLPDYLSDGKVLPEIEEQLMGFPAGYTSIDL